MRRSLLLLLFFVVLLPADASAACDPDRLQDSGSIYRICMPPAASYNGMLVIWAHGFQDAGTPVSIPDGDYTEIFVVVLGDELQLIRLHYPF